MTEKTAVAAPRPMASVRTAAVVKGGDWERLRAA